MNGGAGIRDHGGRIDAAVAAHGGHRADWLDLSTGLNPVPWPLPELAHDVWTALPDRAADEALVAAARAFWCVPKGAQVLAAPGASALIARLPHVLGTGPKTRRVWIPGPTYNEHAAAFTAAGWRVTTDAERGGDGADAIVAVHPNNPDGRLWSSEALEGAPVRIIDESFCDLSPEHSLIDLAARPGTVILKSFGKFWGLGGLRLGFAIGDRSILDALAEAMGPWPISGPALAIGAAALADTYWACRTRDTLATEARRLDALMTARGATPVGGTALFRLYDVEDAALWQERLARHRILGRTFPYSRRWLRLGLPAPARWPQLEALS